jgi:hypothetical protein
VAKCIEIPLHRRYQSAEELRQALTEWQHRTKSPAKRTPLTETDTSLTDLREQAAAQRLVDEAKRLASHQKLAEAADTMEEAFLLDPALRAKHEHRVILWRKGLTG